MSPGLGDLLRVMEFKYIRHGVILRIIIKMFILSLSFSPNKSGETVYFSNCMIKV